MNWKRIISIRLALPQKKLAPKRVKGEFFSADFDEARKIIEHFTKMVNAKLPSESVNCIADKQV